MHSNFEGPVSSAKVWAAEDLYGSGRPHDPQASRSKPGFPYATCKRRSFSVQVVGKFICRPVIRRPDCLGGRKLYEPCRFSQTVRLPEHRAIVDHGDR